MVRVEYGNGKVEVTYSQRRNRSSSSCGSSCSGYSTVQFYSVPYYFQWHKTANVYVKNCSVYIQCKGDIVVVDIKQHKSQFESSNITITQCQKNFADCVMVKFEFLNCDLCCFISVTTMSPLHCI